MNQKYIDLVRSEAIQLNGVSADFDALLSHIGDAQIVLLGEATHGTREFYEIRAAITQRLVAEKKFNAIAIEGDWPDAYHINHYIHGEAITPAHALASFDRFPTWMWRNASMIRAIENLKKHNDGIGRSIDKVSFYGLDVYSLYRSIEVIINFLTKIDPQVAAEARHAYSCFDHYKQDPQLYGYAIFAKVAGSCAYDVIDELKRLQEQTYEWLEKGKISADDAFFIEQNARVIKNAEDYYRALFMSNKNTWNLRDSHMFETLNEIIKHHQLKGIAKPKIVIWAHNSHVGDARATQMGVRGEFNIGQLAKEQFGKDAISIGFTTYNGTVSAASDWHEPVERKFVRKAMPESYEALFHAVGIPNFLLMLQKNNVPEEMLERAIGVVYRPESELVSHYFKAKIAEQFDAIIHCDKTEAVEPLEKTSRWVEGENPETYPTGL